MSGPIGTSRQSHYWIAGRGIVKPIRVEVGQDPSDGHWFVTGPYLIWGCGDSMALAIEDYRAALPQYRDVLRELDLSPDLNEELAWLDVHLAASSSAPPGPR